VALVHSSIGIVGEVAERSWNSTDSLLYSLGVGAGLGDPTMELEFTTEDRVGGEQRVLPTFGVIIASRQNEDLGIGEFDHTMLVAADHYIELHQPLAPQGAATTVSTVTGIYDKGSGALVMSETKATSQPDGRLLATSRSGYFIRGEGGFGGSRGPDMPGWSLPDRAPDHQIVYETRREQALIYRLTGDRNPLHADPAFARQAGFEQPILHGLCTFGITGRALLHALCGSDPAMFRSMYGRFTSPVAPGESLAVSMWRVGDFTAFFRTTKTDGTVVLDHGRLQIRDPEAGD
jgi:acyl dehydratase